MDLFSRKVIVWNLSAKPDTDLIMTTFKRSYDIRKCLSGIMFHSNRRSQSTTCTFRQLLDTLNVVQSFSKKGYPFDNARCECFFKYLKKEEINRITYHFFRSYSYLFSNILRNSKTLGISHNLCFHKVFSNNCFYLLDYGPSAL